MAGNTDNKPETMDRYLQQVIDNSLKEVHTGLPGVITSFNASKQTAEIQLLIKRKFIGEDIRDYPVCINCPVMFPRAGGFVITFPVKAGDECMVMFAERSLDAWMQSGGTQPPIDTRRHSLSDAVAILGLYSQPNKLDAVHSTGIEIKADDGNTYFRLDNGVISIKGDVNIEGNLDITANCDIGGDIDVTGKADIGGDSTAADHISGLVSGNSHVHGGVTTGVASTTGPV